MKFRNTGIIKSFNIGADGIRMPEVYYTILEASEKQNVFHERGDPYRSQRRSCLQQLGRGTHSL